MLNKESNKKRMFRYYRDRVRDKTKEYWNSLNLTPSELSEFLASKGYTIKVKNSKMPYPIPHNLKEPPFFGVPEYTVAIFKSKQDTKQFFTVGKTIALYTPDISERYLAGKELKK